MNKLKLPMRDGVGVIILNKKNEVFVGKRKDNPCLLYTSDAADEP